MVPSNASADSATVSDSVGMRMNREADVGRIRAHLDGQRHFGHQLARVRAHHAAAQHAMRNRIEQ